MISCVKRALGQTQMIPYYAVFLFLSFENGVSVRCTLYSARLGFQWDHFSILLFWFKSLLADLQNWCAVKLRDLYSSYIWSFADRGLKGYFKWVTFMNWVKKKKKKKKKRKKTSGLFMYPVKKRSIHITIRLGYICDQDMLSREITWV